MNELRFHAMGTEIVVGAREPIAFDAVARLFRDREATFSRFIAGSELNRVNTSAGRVVRASIVFVNALSLALRLADETHGLVDPTLGAALEAAGYRDDFESLRPDPSPAAPARAGTWRSVRILGRCVAVPPGARLDLNGVVKALAVDDALALLPRDGSYPPAAISRSGASSTWRSRTERPSCCGAARWPRAAPSSGAGCGRAPSNTT